MRKWERADLIHVQNLRKSLLKIESLKVDTQGVVETYHAFRWLDKIVDEIEAALSSDDKVPETLEEGLKTAEIKKNKEAKTSVKSTKRSKK
jgi:hypothetical protein